jgi:subtilisin-like proprotein convertase family protein
MAGSALGGLAPLPPSTAQQFTAIAVPITISQNSVATPYADSKGLPNSTNIVDASVKGTIEKMSVTLNGFSHTYPNDVQVMLVGPNGSGGLNGVVLMANIGGGQSASGLTLTFDDVGASPGTAPLASGFYAPTVNPGNPNVIAFPAPAPTTAIYTTLAAAFSGSPIAGTWYLYVLDNNFGSSGSIQSWTLNFWQAPTISAVSTPAAVNENGQFNTAANQNLNTTTITVTVADPTANAVQLLKVSGTCSPAAGTPPPFGTAPLASVTLEPATQGSLVQTLLVTPSTNQSGTATISVSVTDGSGNVVTFPTTVNLTVNPENEPPFFVNNKITVNGAAVPSAGVTIPQAGISEELTLEMLSPNSLNGLPANLGVVVTSSDSAVVSPSGVMFDGPLPFAAPTSPTPLTRDFTIVPNGTASGTATLFFYVYDQTALPAGETNVVALPVTVTAAAAESPAVYAPMTANSGQINLVASTAPAVTSLAAAIPAESGLGPVSKLTVSINGLVNVSPSTMTITLTSPDGKTTATLLQGAVGGSAGDVTASGTFNFAQITFDDGGAPASELSTLLSASDINNIDVQPHVDLSSANLSGTFAGVNPTGGQWKLTVTGGGPNAAIVGGWELTVYSGPQVVVTSGYNAYFVQGAQGIIISYTASSIDGAVASAQLLGPNLTPFSSTFATINSSKTTFTASSGVGAPASGSFTLNGNAAGIPPWGTNQLYIAATDTKGLVALSAPINLGFVFANSPPTISQIAKQVTTAGAPTTPAKFVVSDPDYDPAFGIPAPGAAPNQNLTLTATSDSSSILPSENIILQLDPTFTDGRHWLVTLYPVAPTPPNTPVNVTIVVSDNSTTDYFPPGVLLSSPQTAPWTFPLVVNEQTVSLFTVNPAGAVINMSTPQAIGTPYPSVTQVPAAGSPQLLGTVAGVSVNIYGIYHYNPQDITLLLTHTDPVSLATKSVLLMQDAGIPSPSPSLTALIFSDSAGSEIQPGVALTSGTFLPTAYGSTITFPPVVSGGSVPPGPPYGSELAEPPNSGFFGMNPNGPWQLYAYEGGLATDKGGEIVGGWQLSITTAPNIQPITSGPSVPFVVDEAPTANYGYTPQSIPIVVGDIDPNVTAASVTAVAVDASGFSPPLPGYNPVLFKGNGTYPGTTITTVAATPSGSTANTFDLVLNLPPFITGTVPILVTATDTKTKLFSTYQFILEVQPFSYPPVISSVTANGTTLNAPFTAPLAVTMPAATPLVLQFTAVDQPPDVGIGVSTASFVASPTNTVPLSGTATVNPTSQVVGTGTFTVTVTPAGIGYGSATVSFGVQDTVNNKVTSVSFVVNFTPAEAWINSQPLTLPAGLPVDGEAYFTGSPASPFPPSGYPSTIPVGSAAGVSSVPGVVESVGVTVEGFSSVYPEYVDMLLVHRGLNPPSTNAVLLMSHPQVITPVNGLNLTFTNLQQNFLAIGTVPGPGGSPVPGLTSGTYYPAQYGSQPSFPDIPSYTASLLPNLDMTKFVNTDPNGYWDLYVLDDTYYPQTAAGAISGGWFLVLKTGPAVTWIGGDTLTVNEDATKVTKQFQISDLTVDPKTLSVSANVITEVPYTNYATTPPTIYHVPVLTGLGGVLPIPIVNITDVGNNSATGTIQITPATDLPSRIVDQNITATVQLTVTDTANNPPSGYVAHSDLLTVTVQNQIQSPVITVQSPYSSDGVSTALTYDANKIPEITFPENTYADLTFSIYDVNEPLVYGGLTITPANTTVVPTPDLTKTTVTGFSPATPTAAAALAEAAYPQSPNVGTVTVAINGGKNQFTPSASPTLVTIQMTDGLTPPNITYQPVWVNITHVEQPPTMSLIGPATITLPAGGQQSFSIDVATVETGPLSIVVTPSVSQGVIGVSPASQTVLVNQNGIGPQAPCTFTVTSLAGQATTGSGAVISFDLNDKNGGELTAANNPTNLTVVVNAPAGTTYGSSTPITIGGTTGTGPFAASQYPSSFSVSDNYPGGIFDVEVVIPGFTASDPQNVDLLLAYNNNLASPNNVTKTVMLMSGAGGSRQVGPLELAFDDGAQYSLLQPGVTLVSSTNHPSDLSPTDVLPTTGNPPPPVGPYQIRLNTFTAVNPEGTWSLYVSDKTAGDTVSLPSGWAVVISTLPTLTPPAGGTVLNTSPTLSAGTIPPYSPEGYQPVFPVTAGAPLILSETTNTADAVTTTVILAVNEDPSQSQLNVTTLTPSYATLKGTALVNVTLGTIQAGANNQSGTLALNITPVYLAAGNDTVTVTVTRSDGAEAVYSLPVSVTPNSVAPTITHIPTVSIAEGTTQPYPVTFVVSDPDIPLSDLQITATVVGSSPGSLLVNSDLAFVSGGSVLALPGSGVATMLVSQGAAISGDSTARLITLNITPNQTLAGQAQVQISVAPLTGTTSNEGASTVGKSTTAPAFNVIVSALPAFVNVPSILPIQGGIPYPLTVTVSSANAGPIVSLTPSPLQTGAPIISVNPTLQSTVGAPNPTTWIVTFDTAAVGAGTAYPTPPYSQTVNLTATDSTGAQNTVPISVTVVQRRDQIFSNLPNNGTATIMINANTTATPYPSIVNVPTGTFNSDLIASVTVTLNQFWHTFPSDVGILLVSPANTPIVLMENASSVSVPQSAPINLSFSGNPAYPVLPAVTPMQSQTYQPANYNTSYVFPAGGAVPPPPASSGYVGVANEFPNMAALLAGESPFGQWRLYVVDERQLNGGQIVNGWSLDITTAPQITFASGLYATNPVSNGQSSSAQNTFTMLDDSHLPLSETVAPYYAFHVTSSAELTGVPAANVKIQNPSGDQIHYTVAVTPSNPNQTISTPVEITISGTDPDGLAFSGSFYATFTPYNAGPTLAVNNEPTAKNPLVIPSGTVGEVSFNFSDSQVPPAPLLITVISTNLVNFPLSAMGLNVNYANGSGTLQIAPLGNDPILTNWITLVVAQTVNENGLGMVTNTFSFPVVLVSPTPVQAANAQINIAPNSPATPDPSPMFVTNLSGVITKATVTLDGFTHTYPSDVSVLLVGPNGQGVVLMSQAGSGNYPVTNVFLTFDDSAPNGQLPRNSQIYGGTYVTSPFRISPVFAHSGVTPAPPAGPYQASLGAAFNGYPPGGWWYLYVQDESAPNSGWITNGWSLTLQTTGPQISAIDPQQVNENANQPLIVSFSVSPGISGDKITVTPSLVNSSPAGPLVTLGTPQLADSTGTNYTVAITPALNMPSQQSTGNGTVGVTITATDTTQSPTVANSLTFPLTVVYEAQPPVFVGLPAAKMTPATQPTNGTFSVNEPDLGAQVTLANLGVAEPPTTGVNIGTLTITANGVNSWNWNFTPNGVVNQATWTVLASYAGYNVQSSITISTGPGTAPTITGVTNELIVFENQVGDITFTAGNLALATVTNLTWSTDNPNLISGVSFGFNGTAYTAAVNLVPYQNNQTAPGPADVTIGVGDQFGTNTVTVPVTVIPIAVPPAIGQIQDVGVQVGTPSVQVHFTVTDPAVPASSTFTFATRVSNPSIVSGPISFSQTGPGAYAATINLVPNQVGISTITILATDVLGNTGAQAFALVVSPPSPPVFGALADVSTTVGGAAISVNLVVSSPISPLTYSYKSSQTSIVPAAGGVLFNPIRFPTGNGAVETAQIVPVNNVAGSTVITIYVSDNINPPVSQSFAFTVNNPAGPTLAAIGDQTTQKNTPLTVALTVTPGLTPLSGLHFITSFSNPNVIKSVSVNTSGTFATAVITPVTGAYGVSSVTIAVTDHYTTNSQSFGVLVLPTPPTIGPISEVTALVGSVVTVPLNVVSPDTAVSQLTFIGSSTNSGLVSGVSFSTVGTNVTATVNLVPNKVGTATVQVEVSDGYSAPYAQSFTLSVVSAPTLAATLVGTTLKITFTGLPNTPYVIQSSPDLKTWTAVGAPITSGANGSVEFDAPVNTRAQYFRALFQ